MLKLLINFDFAIAIFVRENKNKIYFKCFFLAIFVAVFVFNLFFIKNIKAATDTEQVTLSVTVAGEMSISCDASVDLGTLTPSTPVTGTSVCTVTTSAENGYDLKVMRDDATSTLDKISEGATDISDKTTWDPTANGGTGNAATWSGTGLGFTVFASTATKSTTWWGTGTTETDANNKYAGIPPTTYATIMDHDSYSESATTNSIGFKLDVPSTQKSGSYDGTITFQSVTKP